MENQTMLEAMATDAQFIQGQIEGALRAHRSRMAAIKERRNEARLREMDFDAGVADALRIADQALRR
jgi:hypothetical protein